MGKHTNTIIIMLLTACIGLVGWVGQSLYTQVQLNVKTSQKNSERLTTVETLLIDRTEAITRLSILEHDVKEIKYKIEQYH